MNNADIVVIKNAIKSVEDKVFRDYNELENLQNSNAITNFSNMTIEKLKKDFLQYFLNKKENYSIIIKDGPENKIEKARKNIYINCITGVKNFVHSIPYFATIIAVRENGKVITAIINNYATQQMYIASAGQGAFVNNKRIRVSNKLNMSNVLIAVKYDNKKEKFSKILDKLNLTFKINNCTALDICQTSEGKLDGGIVFDGNAEELEIEKLFIKESGGIFEFLNEEKTECLYSNSLIHNNLKEILK